MPILQAIHEHGAANFAIHPEAEFSLREEASNAEKLYIIALRATEPGIGYNVHPGGFAPVPSEYSRGKMSRAALNRAARAKPGERFYRTTRCPKGHLYRGKNLIIKKRGDGREIKHCRICEQARDRERLKIRRPNAHHGIGRGGINKAKTHCKRGHEFTAQNARITPQGGRQCRACVRFCRRNVIYKGVN